ncbi:MAG: phosphoenolpyruvate--protein phosphotransferase [Deltaproteobacteria bacterium]|nr:phosphoenolpyruvate--protein phosphotransferase [Deltaproteobacteria bacterium]
MSGQREQVLTGLGVSYGISIGRAVCVENHLEEVFRLPLPAHSIDAEVARYHEASELTIRELTQVKMGELPGDMEDGLQEEIGGILEAHILLLKDPSLVGRVTARIRGEHVNAEWAVHRTTAELAEQFEAIEDDYLRGRGQDLHDVGTYLLRALQGISHHELSEVEGDIILVADDLPPGEAVRLGRHRVVGFAIGSGGRTSHTTIIARSLKVPAVGGLASVTQLVTDEDPVIVDGGAGTVILHPTAETLEKYARLRQAQDAHDLEQQETRHLPSVTLDGTQISLMANIDLPEEIHDAANYGAQGVGLYRSEFLYIEQSPKLPTEEQHLRTYTLLAREIAPNPVIIRTYDLGGRKLARELMNTREENPVLGLRGIRLTMARREMFRTQIRALFRAAYHHDVRVMLPLVTSVDEVREFRVFAQEIAAELSQEGIAHNPSLKIGIMIEVPCAAIIADLLAREVDFFSVGTNDLLQYSLAVDRNNEHVAHLYQPLHPAILRMLRFILESARQAGIEVGMCGEMAGDPRLVPLLLGLGLRRLSMSPRLVPEVKACVRSLSLPELEQLAVTCGSLATAEEVDGYLDRFLKQTASMTEESPLEVLS